MIDSHSHILPEMDDGSGSVDESLRMTEAYSDRVTDIFLTPHFYPTEENPDDFFERREASAAKLRNALEGKSAIKFHLGAEVAYFNGIHASESMERFRIEGTRLLLVEMPMREWNARMFDELVELNRNLGLRPVLAHIDRYNFAKGRIRRYLEYYLENRGLVQVNAEAMAAMFSRRTAISMIRAGAIHFMGSDCHNTGSRRPNYDEAIDRIIKSGAEDVLDIIYNNEKTFIQ
ncbi:MAG: hypothetical protein J5940_04050 [Clostridia bacterium]|nr:hypothetical protein [Clostridia bacterium]